MSEGINALELLLWRLDIDPEPLGLRPDAFPTARAAEAIKAKYGDLERLAEWMNKHNNISSGGPSGPPEAGAADG